MRALGAIALVACACAAPPAATDAGPAPTPRDPVDAATPTLDPRFDDCAHCHADEARQHAATLHAQAFDDPLFQREWSIRPSRYCVDCHAPLARDASDPRAHEGIGCASCHVEGATIVSREIGGAAPHPSRADPAFSDPERCGPCHEFDFPTRHGPARERLQRTLSEWRASARDERCIDCHMHDGSHALVGPRDEGMLARALDVDVVGRRRGRGVVARFALRVRGAGHAVPTGDLTRNLVLRITDRTGASAEAELSRLFGRDEDDEVIETADQRVLPGVERRVELVLARARGPIRWSLTWNALAPEAAHVGSIDPAFRTREIAHGVVSLRR